MNLVKKKIVYYESKVLNVIPDYVLRKSFKLVHKDGQSFVHLIRKNLLESYNLSFGVVFDQNSM